MYKSKALLFVLVILLIILPLSNAKETQGSHLLKTCLEFIKSPGDISKYKDNLDDENYCKVVLTELVNLTKLLNSTTKKSTHFICLPKNGFTIINAAEALISFLLANPDKFDNNGLFLVNGALAKTYPCINSKPRAKKPLERLKK